jgi:Icc-related predicted phosphoesterase
MGIFSPPESPFAPPSLLYQLTYHPLTTCFTFFHNLLLYLRGAPYLPPKNKLPIRVVCLSDTHSKVPRYAIPKGDLLIHSGDLTNTGTLASIQQTLDWLKTLQKPWPGSSDGFRHIVVVAGNHDSYFDERSRSAHDRKNSHRTLNLGKIHYLQHSSVTLPFPGDRNLKVYGAPQIPQCGGKEFAFQYQRGQDAWTATIPDDVDVLITHNPPKWHLDLPASGGLGDEFELKETWRVKPTLHAFGHVHSGHGVEPAWWDESQKAWEEYLAAAYNKPAEVAASHRLPLTELLDLPLWWKGIESIVADVRGLLWTRLWGGARQGGYMVNGALTYQIGNQLWNKPKVVVL